MDTKRTGLHLVGRLIQGLFGLVVLLFFVVLMMFFVTARTLHATITDPGTYQAVIEETNLAERGKGVLADFLITSAVHGEGKSVTSLNLALSLAEQDHLKVLLIDADLRRGSQHKLLGLKNQKGLSTALESDGEVGNMLVRLPNTRLSVLLCGAYPKQPAELLDYDREKLKLAVVVGLPAFDSDYERDFCDPDVEHYSLDLHCLDNGDGYSDDACVYNDGNGRSDDVQRVAGRWSGACYASPLFDVDCPAAPVIINVADLSGVFEVYACLLDPL